MFHLYFGAFDIVLYLGATYSAMVLAKAICEERPVEMSEAATSAEALPSALQPAATRVDRPFAVKTKATSRVTVSVQ